MFSGQAAIEFFSMESIKYDPGASLHWLKYHSEFKFNGQEFSGLQGFGGWKRPPNGSRLWLELLLQRRFRHFGDAYSDFNSIDSLAFEVASSNLDFTIRTCCGK